MSPAPTSESSVTARFQLNVARVLEPISPSLAALHVNRARLTREETRDDLALSHCTICGVFLLDGTGSTRILRHVRRRKRPKKEGESPRLVRAMRLSCGVCGHEEDIPVETRGNSIREKKPTVGIGTAIPEPPKSTPTTALKSVGSSTHPRMSGRYSSRSSQGSTFQGSGNLQPPTSPRPKTRLKKSSSLQDMLARNKQREEREKQKRSIGLSAFLEGL